MKKILYAVVFSLGLLYIFEQIPQTKVIAGAIPLLGFYLMILIFVIWLLKAIIEKIGKHFDNFDFGRGKNLIKNGQALVARGKEKIKKDDDEKKPAGEKETAGEK